MKQNSVLKQLHENLMQQVSRQPRVFGQQMPIEPKASTAVIVPQERWALVKAFDVATLEKTFSFLSLEERNDFVIDAIDIEARYKHCAVMTLDGLEVHVRLTTKNVGVPTEVDKELAVYLDEVYRDVTFAARMEA